MTNNWGMTGEVGASAEDYFGQQKKQLQVADRRPVIRKASDLVGPGVSGQAVRLDDFNDTLATFDGYFSALAGSPNAPNEVENFVGTVSSDAELGGIQAFTGLATGTEYTRTFQRTPYDARALVWGPWRSNRIISTGTTTNPGINPLFIPPGVQTTLTPPDMVFDGPEDYSIDGDQVSILRQGVYTGFIEVIASAFFTVDYLITTWPARNVFQTIITQQNNVGEGVWIPFTFRATTGLGYIKVEVTHGFVAPTTLVHYRLNIARIGDAL